jgi:hypothetical protein
VKWQVLAELGQMADDDFDEASIREYASAAVQLGLSEQEAAAGLIAAVPFVGPSIVRPF